MALFLITEIVGGIVLYQEQADLQNDVHNSIRVAVERHYGNDLSNTTKLDLIQEAVSILCCSFISHLLSLVLHSIEFNWLFLFVVEMLRNDGLQELVPLRVRQTPHDPRFHRQGRHLHGPQILLPRPIVHRMRASLLFGRRPWWRSIESSLSGGIVRLLATVPHWRSPLYLIGARRCTSVNYIHNFFFSGLCLLIGMR